jgi:hypothetical protein
MDNQYYNRYLNFTINGEQTVVPYVKLGAKPTDRKYFYVKDVSRLDKISQEIYGTPYFGWLIMMANPQYGGLEWNIPNGAMIIIPYPLISSIQDYESNLKNYFYYYGR